MRTTPVTIRTLWCGLRLHHGSRPQTNVKFGVPIDASGSYLLRVERGDEHVIKGLSGQELLALRLPVSHDNGRGEH